MMERDPAAVARTAANGTADCGVTFRQPGTWPITAQLTWQTCWVAQVVNGPPPAACAANPVPGAALNPADWALNAAVHDINAATGPRGPEPAPRPTASPHHPRRARRVW